MNGLYALLTVKAIETTKRHTQNTLETTSDPNAKADLVSKRFDIIFISGVERITPNNSMTMNCEAIYIYIYISEFAVIFEFKPSIDAI